MRAETDPGTGMQASTAANTANLNPADVDPLPYGGDVTLDCGADGKNLRNV